ncbi:MAG: FliI/YscN family ATPase [Phycisphaeraceae bacterium]|nr:FliI/YscN family ATPase [Phycisphaeraceae bacterium]
MHRAHRRGRVDRRGPLDTARSPGAGAPAARIGRRVVVNLLEQALSVVRQAQPLRIVGRVEGLKGLTVLVHDLPLPVGSLVRIGRGRGGEDAGEVFGEVVGFSQDRAIVMLLGQGAGIRPGDSVVGEQPMPTVGVGPNLLGRVLDGLLRPLDGRPWPRPAARYALSPEPVGAMRRRPIREGLHTGVRAIDLMTPLGRGQRMGIFAGPGVGKSTLLGSIAQNTSADVNVIALIGERGREVRDFVESSLGDEGLARSVVIVATGDESPLMRIRAAKAACAAAEYFRDQGLAVLLMMDSVTRFAHAQRQVGLSVGEPPSTRGYTPSVFAQMALLLERAGAIEHADGTHSGSITGLYTILVEGDDLTEPVTDAARGILDGHIILSRALAQKGHYPAIDVLDSVSRVAGEVCDEAHLAARRTVVRLLATYGKVEELIQVGAYASGSDPVVDTAIEYLPVIEDLLMQGHGDRGDFADARSRLVKLAHQAEESLRLRVAGRRKPEHTR